MKLIGEQNSLSLPLDNMVEKVISHRFIGYASSGK